jgi:pimeloyl-ACP methyl ester carboxylesterase
MLTRARAGGDTPNSLILPCGAHSRGGAVVLEVAKKYPELIRTLVLADASARIELPESEENLKAVAFCSRLFADFRQDVAKGDIEGGMACFVDVLVGPGFWESLPAALQKGFLQNVQTALVKDLVPLATDDEPRKFNFPVLMLTGGKSPPLYGLLISEMRKRAGFKPPVIIPGAGHALSFCVSMISAQTRFAFVATENRLPTIGS